MRMTPAKTKPIARHIRVKFLMWGIAVRMKRLWRDPDVWLTVSTAPADGSPWAQTRAYASGVEQIDSGSVIHAAEPEAQLRLDAVHDYFVGTRGAMWTRSVYSLHALCRSTIEACAFAAWVFDPDAAPAVRLPFLAGLGALRQIESTRPTLAVHLCERTHNQHGGLSCRKGVDSYGAVAVCHLLREIPRCSHHLPQLRMGATGGMSFDDVAEPSFGVRRFGLFLTVEHHVRFEYQFDDIDEHCATATADILIVIERAGAVHLAAKPRNALLKIGPAPRDFRPKRRSGRNAHPCPCRVPVA